jgi:hypothetical protein
MRSIAPSRFVNAEGAVLSKVLSQAIDFIPMLDQVRTITSVTPSFQA